MSFCIEYCSPLKSFQHSVSLFLSTIIIGEGKVEEEKKKKEGIILRERDELKVGACSLCHGKNENGFFAFSFDSMLSAENIFIWLSSTIYKKQNG